MPNIYPPNLKLGTRVKNQRSQYMVLQNGKRSYLLTKERFRKLNAIGFIWYVLDRKKEQQEHDNDNIIIHDDVNNKKWKKEKIFNTNIITTTTTTINTEKTEKDHNNNKAIREELFLVKYLV